jgi:DNA-binding XRE family transcriptional regulator
MLKTMTSKTKTSNLTTYVAKRKVKDLVFADGFDSGYADFKIGVLLRQARELAGLTQEQIAIQLGTKKSVISRIENHADNVTLTTLKSYAKAVGRNVQIKLVANQAPSL